MPNYFYSYQKPVFNIKFGNAQTSIIDKLFITNSESTKGNKTNFIFSIESDKYNNYFYNYYKHICLSNNK